MRVSLAQWLKDNETTIAPTWIRAVRQRSERDRTLTTQQLGQDLLLSYFDCFVKAAATGVYDELETLVERIATDRAGREYNLNDVLLIPFLLRETIWTQLIASASPVKTLELIQVAQPIFELSLTTLVRTFARATAAALNKRLEETEFLARRLAEATEQTDRALAQLRTLYELSRALSSTLDINETLNLIAEELASIHEINSCTIWLEATATSELHVAVAKGIDSDKLADTRLFLRGHTSIVVEAFLTRQIKGISQISDSSHPREALAHHFTGQSIVALPLISEDLSIGVILGEYIQSFDDVYETKAKHLETGQFFYLMRSPCTKWIDRDIQYWYLMVKPENWMFEGTWGFGIWYNGTVGGNTD